MQTQQRKKICVLFMARHAAAWVVHNPLYPVDTHTAADIHLTLSLEGDVVKLPQSRSAVDYAHRNV